VGGNSLVGSIPHKSHKLKDMNTDSIVYYKDDVNKHPFLVHAVLDNNQVILGLAEYPDVEQDFSTPIDILSEFEGEEKTAKARQIYYLIEQ
jgi:hypothetical protein